MDEVVSTAVQSLDEAAHVFSGSVKAESWTAVLARVGVAGAIVAAGLVLLWLGSRGIRKVFCMHRKKEEDQGSNKTLEALLISLFRFLVYFVMACMALSALGVNVESILAFAGVGGLAVGFGCQTLVKDFVSGLFLWLEGHLKVGDVVTVGGMTGKVEAMKLRTTSLRASNGNLYTIPNGDIRTVVNMTRDFRYALVDVTVSHQSDYQKAMDALQLAMEELNQREEDLEETPRVVGLISCDRFSASIRMECKCDVEKCWQVERKIRQAALECLKKEGIAP